MVDIQSPTAENRRGKKKKEEAAKYNEWPAHYYGMGGRRTPAINTRRSAADSVQVAQLSQRDRATHELLRFAKLRSGILSHPFGGA